MWNFLFGWMVGRGISRSGANAALPESAKEERYAAAQRRRAKAKETRAVWLGIFVLFVIAYWIVRGIASLF